MRNKQIHLKIEKPCHENWQSMTPTEKGKFCLHCQKTVIDFTQMTDNEIIKYVESNSGKLCGRFTKQQNDRFYAPYQSNSNIGPIYNLAAGILLLGTAINANGQTEKLEKRYIVEVENSSVNTKKYSFNKQSSNFKNHIIEGTVMDRESKDALVGVSVHIKDSEIKTTTDVDGKFTIEIPQNFPKQDFILLVEYIGFMPFELFISKNELPISKKIYLLEDNQFVLGEVINIKKRSPWMPRKK